MEMLNCDISLLNVDTECTFCYANLIKVVYEENNLMSLRFEVSANGIDSPEFYIGNYFINGREIKCIDHIEIPSNGKKEFTYKIKGEESENFLEVLISPYIVFRNKTLEPVFDAFFDSPYYLEINRDFGEKEACYFDKRPKFKEADIVKEIPVDVVVYKEGAENIHFGHEVKNVKVISYIFDPERGLIREVFDAHYCEDCDMYFVSNREYIDMLQKGQLLCNTKTREDLIYNLNDKEDKILIMKII